MENLSTASTRRSSFNDPYLQITPSFRKLPTAGDGNCLIHALFGNLQTRPEVFHPKSPFVRREIAQKIRTLRQGNNVIEQLYSIDETGLNHSTINTDNLADSLRENGQYLGLEHAHLIAKLFKINIRVYYPKSNNYENIDLFYRDPNTQEEDRMIVFNGTNHWEKCVLNHEPHLPACLAFTHPQFNPKYRRIFANNTNYSPSERITANTQAIATLKQNNHQRMANSYLFKFCRPQEYNKHFLKTFAEFFQYIRGSAPLAQSTGYALVGRVGRYEDVCESSWEFNHDDHINRWEVTYSPTPEVITELKNIIEEEHGLKDFFFETLQSNHFCISEEFKLEDRDTCFREFPVFPRVYPRCSDILKDVFTDLLSQKWLENDINGLKYYLDQNTPIERPIDIGKLAEAKRVWKLVKQAVDAKINHDEKLNKHFYDELKKDIKNLGISSMISLGTGNLAFFAGGVGRTVINTLGNYSDPEGKQASIQMMKLLGGSGLGKLMGGDVFELGTSLGIDLVDFAVRDDKTTKNEGSALSVYTSVLKGLFTGDKQKLIAQVLGACVAETAERVDDKDAPLDIKIALALLKNPDTRGLIVNDLVNDFSKEKPKTGGELTPEEQEKYPKQEPTLAEVQQQAEFDKWQEDSRQHTAELTAAKNELIQKEAGVKNAEKHLNEKLKKYDKAVFGRDKLWEKVEKAQRNFNNAVREKNTALNTVLSLEDQPIIVYPKEPKQPKPKTVVGKVWKWTKENVAVSGEMTVTKTPLYTTKPSRATDRYVPREAPSRPQSRQPRTNLGQWEGVQAMQQQQMFNANMQYQSPVLPAPSQPLSWGQGLAQNVQLPPTDFSHLGRNIPIPRPLALRNQQLQMAGFVPLQPMIDPAEAMHPLIANDFTKSLPKGALKTIAAVCTLMLPDMSDIKGAEDPREHFKRAFNYGLKKYDKFVDIQDPNSFGAKAGEFVGEMVALGGVGKVIRVAEGISMIGMACEGGFCGAIMSETHETNKVAGIAFGFVGGGVGAKLLFRGGGVSKPLLDRALVMPEGFGRQLRNTEIQQVLKCGFVSNKTVMRLTEREIQAIKPMEFPYLKKGADLDWFAKNSPRIDHLRNMHPPKDFYKELSKEFRKLDLNELQIRRTLNHAGFKTYPIPQGIPTECSIELSKLSGGMIYRKPGTTTSQNMLVRVMPGKAKESIVSSVHKGNHLNGKMPGSLRQQYPYVVQTRGKLKLTIHGEWIETSLAVNKHKEGLTHIPLEIYEFKGW